MHIKKSVSEIESDLTGEYDISSHPALNFKPPMLRKGKLVLVDLAGSERVLKSGMPLNCLDLIRNYNAFIFCLLSDANV